MDVNVIKLTYYTQKGEGNDQVRRPVEAVGEGEGSSSHVRREYFAQDEPGHCRSHKPRTRLEL